MRQDGVGAEGAGRFAGAPPWLSVPVPATATMPRVDGVGGGRHPSLSLRGPVHPDAPVPCARASPLYKCWPAAARAPY